MRATITQETINELQTLCAALADLNNTGKYTTFFDFAGHVCTVSVQIYRGKWNRRKKRLIYNYINIDRPLSEEDKNEGLKDIPQMLEYIKTLKEQIR